MRPCVSVVIPTRNRAAHAADCAMEILKGQDFLELIVIDQSDGDQTETALAGLNDPRVTCVRSPLRGASNGRNAGIARARGDVIAFTDDDCRVAPNWVTSISHIFETDRDAALVFGRVRVPEELRALGFVPGFEPQTREWQGRFPPVERDWGISANMAMRRSVAARIGGFDPVLGVGAPLRSGEEPDLIFRALRAGLKVINAEEVIVDHFGVRTDGDAARKLSRAYAAGTGAAFMKHVRLLDPDGMRLFLAHLRGCGKLVLTNVLHLHRPLGLGYAAAFISGSLTSLSHPLDRESRLYVAPRVARDHRTSSR